MAGTVLGAIANPVFAGAKMIAGSLTNQYQSDLNNANKTALTSLGYKTNYELGNMSDPGRIAGNPANDVFAGMNAVSATGDISKGAASRIGTIEKTISKMTPAQKKKSSLPARLEKFEGLPPTWMFTVSLDLFRDENVDYAKKLMSAGVSCDLVVYPGACHAFQQIETSELAKRYREDFTAALRRGLGG
jgi:acetyl esterase/lipase